MRLKLPRRFVACILLVFAPLALSACSPQAEPAGDEEEAAEYERGPHNGRLLRNGDFAVEMTIAEEGVPPEFHVYAYMNDRPIAPQTVRLTVQLRRLDEEVNRFRFAAVQDYLRGDGVVEEPHSFDVTVVAEHGNRRHAWQYQSYEGRTTITPEAARQAGIQVERAGPAVFEEIIEVNGQVELAPGAQSEIGARFPGRVMAVMRNVGDRVSPGTVLARVESSESLQTYSVTSPRGGIVLERRTNVGDVTGSDPIFIIGDPANVYAAFPIYPRDMERVQPGQVVIVQGVAGPRAWSSRISGFLPVGQEASQTITARVPLPSSGGYLRAGMAVRGRIVVARTQVPLAVRTRALQAFRDFTVVFARVGNSYEVRMLELGRQTPEWTEVRGGIRPGQEYVTENSFVIKADIERSGASHDH